jgi:hypothetical protein
MQICSNQETCDKIIIMEILIWVLAIFAVIGITAIYVITSVGKYSNSFMGKYFKDKDDPENKTIDKKTDY